MRKYLRSTKVKKWIKFYKIYFFNKNLKKYGQNRSIIIKKLSQFLFNIKRILSNKNSKKNIKLNLIGGTYWRSSYFYDDFFLKKQSLSFHDIFFWKKKYSYKKKSNDYILLKFFTLYCKYFSFIILRFKETKSLMKIQTKSFFIKLIKLNYKFINFLVLSKLIIIFF